MNGNSRSQTVARNIVVSFLTQIVSWGLTLAVTLFLPRYVGDTGLGKLAFAGAFGAVMGAIISLGTSAVLMREVARDVGQAFPLLRAVLTLRIVSGSIFLSLGAVALAMSNLPPQLRILVLLTGAGILIGALTDALAAILSGLGNMTRQGIAALCDKFLASGLTIALVLYRAPLWALACVGIISGLVGLSISVYSVVVGRHRTLSEDTGQEKPDAITPRPLLFTTMWTLVIAGIPFMGHQVFQMLYGQTDPIVLRIVADDATVGWYAAGFRLIGTSLFIPSALNPVLFPLLSRLFTEDKAKFDRVARQTLSLLVLLAIPVSLTMICLPRQIIDVLGYPESFAPSIPVIRIGGAGVLIWYIANGLGITIMASDQQKGLARGAVMACVLGIPLCVIASLLGHRFWGNGAAGAMLSDVLLEAFLVCFYLRLAPKNLTSRQTLGMATRCLLAGVPMALILLYAASTIQKQSVLFLLGTVALGSIAYLIMCLLLRCIDPDFLTLVREMSARFRPATAAK